MRALGRAALLLVLAGVLTQPLFAQQAAAPLPPGASAVVDSARALRGGTLSLSLLTFGAADGIDERFGHVALEIHDTVSGQDVAYNWGMFDFDQPNFLVNFLTGDTRYWMQGYPTSDFTAAYMRRNRSIRRQQLALTPVERAAMLEFVLWNSLDANKFYRYDYYADNCATRIRDALDWVLRGRLKLALNEPGSGRTWRGETERASATNLPMYAGIEVALGHDADQPLTKWEEAFLPELMAQNFQTVVLRNGDGRRYRMVTQDTVLFAADRLPVQAEPPDRVMMSLLVGLALAGIIAALADASAPVVRALLAFAAGLWYAIGGIAGTLLLLAGTVTKHSPYMGRNTTLLLLHPLLLVAAVAVPAALLRQERTRTAMSVSGIAALFAVLAVMSQLVPRLAQQSGVVLAVVVPVHLALAMAVWRLGSSDHATS